LIFAQIFSDHFSSAASFASIYSSSALIRDDRLVGELEETFFKGKHLNINQFDEHFYDEVMGEYITMTLSDDEGEEDYYNKEISMDELEGAILLDDL
jgi:hypothetical protein